MLGMNADIQKVSSKYQAGCLMLPHLLKKYDVDIETHEVGGMLKRSHAWKHVPDLSQTPHEQAVAVGRSVAHISIDADVGRPHANQQVVSVQHLHLCINKFSAVNLQNLFHHGMR